MDAYRKPLCRYGGDGFLESVELLAGDRPAVDHEEHVTVLIGASRRPVRRGVAAPHHGLHPRDDALDQFTIGASRDGADMW